MILAGLGNHFKSLGIHFRVLEIPFWSSRGIFGPCWLQESGRLLLGVQSQAGAEPCPIRSTSHSLLITRIGIMLRASQFPTIAVHVRFASGFPARATALWSLRFYVDLNALNAQTGEVRRDKKTLRIPKTVRPRNFRALNKKYLHHSLSTMPTTSRRQCTQVLSLWTRAKLTRAESRSKSFTYNSYS